MPQLPARAACFHAGTPPEAHIAECHGQSVGGCSFASVTDAVAGGGQMTGEIDVEAVVFSANPADNPVSATFRCYLTVNDAPQPGADVTVSGTVMVVGAGVVTYTSNSVTDNVQLCQDVSYSNGVMTSECFYPIGREVPPPVVWEVVDSLVCLITVQIPNVPGVLDVNSQGDIWLLGEGSFDCPPYGNVYGFPPNG